MFTQNYGYFYKIVTILWPTTTTRVTSIISVYVHILPYDLDYMHVRNDIIKSLEHPRNAQILKILKNTLLFPIKLLWLLSEICDVPLC